MITMPQIEYIKYFYEKEELSIKKISERGCINRRYGNIFEKD